MNNWKKCIKYILIIKNEYIFLLDLKNNTKKNIL